MDKNKTKNILLRGLCFFFFTKIIKYIFRWTQKQIILFITKNDLRDQSVSTFFMSSVYFCVCDLFCPLLAWEFVFFFVCFFILFLMIWIIWFVRWKLLWYTKVVLWFCFFGLTYFRSQLPATVIGKHSSRQYFFNKNSFLQNKK